MLICIDDKFVIQELQGECVMLNVKTGDYFGLNEVGNDFIKLVDNERTLEEILAELLQVYDVDRQTLLNDIEDLLEEMLDKGILYVENTGS